MIKNILSIIIITALILMTGCNNQQALPEIPDPDPSPSPIAITETDIKSSWQGDIKLQGRIGKDMPIHMSIKIEGENADGEYYYDNIGTPIIISGSLDDDRLSLYEEEDYLMQGILATLISENEIRGVWDDYYTDKVYPIVLVKEGVPLPDYSEFAGNSAPFKGYLYGAESVRHTHSELKLQPITDDMFFFAFNAFNGTHMGGFWGITKVNEDGTADFTTESYIEGNENNTFKFSFDKNDDLIFDTNNYSYSCGAGVYYDKRYVKTPKKNPEDEKFGWIFSDEQEEQFKIMTSKYYEEFLSYNQTFFDYEVIDDFAAQAATFGVRGYQNIGIVMVSSKDGAIMAAISSNYDGMQYFSNNKNYEKPPKTIAEWMDR